jgi:hypothetical protein
MPTEVLAFIVSFLMPGSRSEVHFKQCVPVLAELSTVCNVFYTVARSIYSNLLVCSKRSLQSEVHHSLFSAYLKNPSVTSSQEEFEFMSKHSNGRSGTLDFDNIAMHREAIVARIVPAMYKAKYGPEESLVIVRDKLGVEVGRLEWKNDRYYDHYHMRKCARFSEPSFTLAVNGVVMPSDYQWDGGWSGSIVELLPMFDALADILTPLETLFVLMHALSEDTKAIFVYVDASYMEGIEEAFAMRQYELENKEKMGEDWDPQVAWENAIEAMYPAEYPHARGYCFC